MEVSDIHAAVIVGGSSLIPKIQDQLKEKLKLDELTRNLDAFESAAEILAEWKRAHAQPKVQAPKRTQPKEQVLPRLREPSARSLYASRPRDGM